MLLTTGIHALTKLTHERVCVGTAGPG
jgi:hypothetical protein